MEFKNYYEILGVTPNATPDVIKRAYRKLARKYHPDVSKLPDAENKFKEINEAWEVLGSPQKKQQYDQISQNTSQSRASPRSHNEEEFDSTQVDFSDFFKNLFGEKMGQSTSTEFKRRGQDLHTKIKIPLHLAAQGGSTKITVKTGEFAKNLQVKIPPGTKPQSQIRLKEQGKPGIGGAKPGDLYLEMDIEPHAYFAIHEKDIYLNLPVTPWEAALGAQIEVPTLSGKVTLKVAPNSQNGQKLRLKGKGFPGNPAGDQIVVLMILTPKADSQDAIKLYEQMAHAMPFNPREKWGV